MFVLPVPVSCLSTPSSSSLSPLYLPLPLISSSSLSHFLFLSLSFPLSLSLSPPPPHPIHQAAKCNPPIEEGDQVLYINGKSVAEQSHDNVIQMIRTSREQNPNEMVVIVKPRNLTRVIPSSESEAISQVADAGHVLRQSLTHLKESLSNSGILSLQFDVSQGRRGKREKGRIRVELEVEEN